jgi:DNA topoisomerase I
MSHTGDSTCEFLPGIREALLRELRRSELIAVFGTVSDYITRNAGRASHTFPAIAEYVDGSMTADAQAFSWVPHSVAARLGLPEMSPQAPQATAVLPLRELDADPITGKPMVIMDGRSGPYVTDGELIAPLRKDDDVASITDTRAAELLAERRPAKPSIDKRAPTPGRECASSSSGPPVRARGHKPSSWPRT